MCHLIKLTIVNNHWVEKLFNRGYKIKKQMEILP